MEVITSQPAKLLMVLYFNMMKTKYFYFPFKFLFRYCNIIIYSTQYFLVVIFTKSKFQ